MDKNSKPTMVKIRHRFSDSFELFSLKDTLQVEIKPMSMYGHMDKEFASKTFSPDDWVIQIGVLVNGFYKTKNFRLEEYELSFIYD
jgi:hypothetical protein